MAQCVRCGAYVVPALVGSCPVCGWTVVNRESSQPHRHPTPAESGAIPWECMNEAGFFRALTANLRESLFHPSLFFRRMGAAVNLSSAWLYALVVGSLGLVMNLIWARLIFSSLPSDSTLFAQLTGTGALSPMALVMAPVLISLELIGCTLYFHVLLILFRAKRSPLGATFALTAYSQGASVLNIVPLLGSIVAPCWFLYLVVTGLHCLNGISRKKAFLIIFSPFAICIILASLMGLIVLAASGAAMLNLIKEILMSYR